MFKHRTLFYPAENLQQRYQSLPSPTPAIAPIHQPVVDQKEIDGQTYTVVSRHTRNFNQPLISIGRASKGRSSRREIIAIDPNSGVLKQLYQALKLKIANTSSTKDVLRLTLQATKAALPLTKNLHEFVHQRLQNGNNPIGLHEFVEQKLGFCRHHALLNAYFLFHLVQDGILTGQVIHHRQDISRGAHVWNIFIDERGATINTYTLDSFQDKFACVTDQPDILEHFYGKGVTEEVHKRYNQMETNKSSLSTSLIANLHQRLSQINRSIASRFFPVATFFLFKGGVSVSLDSGVNKQLPHRLAEIYRTLMQYQNEEITVEECDDRIKEIARNALEHPRPGRATVTTEFYRSILEDECNEVQHDGPQVSMF